MASPRVVIIGGGMSAKHSAELLVKHKGAQVTIIQANPFVEWAIAMAYVVVKPELHDGALATDPSKFQVPGVEYKYGVARSVDPQGKQVILASNDVVPYDVLLVATGFALPLLSPGLGVTLEARRAEIQRVGQAIRQAQCVVVAGGGVIGLELAGNVRSAYPDKRVVIVTRDRVLKQWPEAQRTKVERLLRAKNIEVAAGSADAPLDYSLEQGSLTVGGQQIAYDVYLPAFSQGPHTKFLEGVGGLLDAKGCIAVNEFLQSKAHKEIFGVGVTDVKEPFVGVPKLEAQWKTATSNVGALLNGKPLKVHKEGMPGMQLPAVVLVGHGAGGYGYLDVSGLPPPVSVCCCCRGACGFPCCPCLCCWPCCGPCPFGYCCGPPEGEGLAKLMGTMAFKSGGFHFKGFGAAPAQQRMS